MQTGSPVSETAVYIPQADIWADAPVSELHMRLKIQEYVGEELVNALQQARFWITYLNDDMLQKADWTPEGMKIGENVYRTILLSGCHRMPPETAKTLVRFTENGGLLICYRLNSL